MLRFLAIAACVVALAVAAWLVVERPILGTVRVVDADTFAVGGTRVRLHGIDAPERDQSCWDQAGEPWPCGDWATERARALFEGRLAWCERLDTDRYGRAVARCRAGFGRGEGGRLDGGAGAIAAAKEGAGGVVWPWADVGAEIVGRGMATAYRRYSEDYAGVEAIARAKGEGVFAGTMVEPAAHRAGARDGDAGARDGDVVPAAADAPSREAGCDIKGNISANGRIFHRPGGAFYDRTIIDETQGERWFCSPEEAVAAGWRASVR